MAVDPINRLWAWTSSAKFRQPNMALDRLTKQLTADRATSFHLKKEASAGEPMLTEALKA